MTNLRAKHCGRLSYKGFQAFSEIHNLQYRVTPPAHMHDDDLKINSNFKYMF
jgi:hypothetical protein